MIINIISLLILIALFGGFAWLTRRAWRARNRFAHWGGTFLAGLLTLILALFVVISARGIYLVYMPRSVHTVDIQVAGTPEQIARGEHLAAVNCA